MWFWLFSSGLASAAGIVLLLTVMILNVIQLKFTGMLDKEGK